MIKTMRLTTVILIAFSFGPLVVRADVRTDQNLTIDADETVDDDLYIFAETVTVDGTIKGDLIAFGRQVVVNGTVEGDLIASGQSVILNGKVLDDVRIAGQTLTLQSRADVGDDLIAAGFSLDCASGSHVVGDVKFAGYQAIFAGNVDRDLDSATANCELKGQFGGNVNLAVNGNDTPPPPWLFQSPIPIVPSGLTVDSTARIEGDLDYEAVREASISPGASIVGNVNFNQIDPATGSVDEPPTIASRVISTVKQFAALLVVGLIVVFAFPTWTRKVSENVQQRPLACIGWGLLSIVGVFVGVILLLVGTIAIAILLGLVSLESLLPAWLAVGLFATSGLIVGFAVFATWVAKVLVSVWAGNLVISGKEWNPNKKLLSLVIGLLVFVALCAIPMAGGIISLVVTLCGIGAAAICLLTKSKTEHSKPKTIPIQHVA